MDIESSIDLLRQTTAKMQNALREYERLAELNDAQMICAGEVCSCGWKPVRVGNYSSDNQEMREHKTDCYFSNKN